MFKKPKGSSGYEIVQGLKCHKPPMPPRDEMMNYGVAIGLSKWKRTELPSFVAGDIDIFSGTVYSPEEMLSWDEVRREEIIAVTGKDPWTKDSKGQPKTVIGVQPDEFYINPFLEEFRLQEYDRIENGFWFFNKGKPTYITGFNYFYINWWELNTGYPEFRTTDRNLFLFWQYCLEDDNCYGLLEITKRGVGKSYRMGAVAYLETVRHAKAHIGIQSKTEDDAEEMFLTKVVEPYKQLPEFLVPIHNHGTEPQTKLNFFPPAERGASSAFTRTKRDALRSKLDFRNSGERAYDSTTLKFLVQDEIGKLEKKNGDAQKRLGVNRNCVYRDSKMVGKIWASTTVEDMDKGGEQVKKIWYDSDIDKRSAIGRTKSGLYRYFTSALECSYFDAWGFPVLRLAKEEHDAERINKEGDSVEYIGYIQRNPYNIEEAFMTLGGECIYNAFVLQNRQRFLQEFEMTTRGDFEWVDGIRDSKVYFKENKTNGSWEVSWLFENFKDANNVSKGIEANDFITFAPKNDQKFASALDPVSHKQTVELRRSNAAMAVYRKFDPWLDTDQSDTFVADYVARNDNPDDDYENALKACVYFGMSILIENNKNAALDYFYRRGYGDFIMTRPKQTTTSAAQETDGIPSNTPVIEYYIGKGRVHVNEHGHKLNHLRIVRDFLDFNPMKRTKYDLGVASQLCLVAAEKFNVLDYNDSDEYDMGELFG